MALADRAEGLMQNLCAEATEAEVVAAATREPLPPAYEPPAYVPPPSASAPGEGAMGEGPLWAACWERCRLESLPGFPLWTYDVHEILRGCFGELRRIFSHYAVEGAAITDAFDPTLGQG